MKKLELKDLFKTNLVFVNKTFVNKNEALKFLAQVLTQRGYAKNAKQVFASFSAREKIDSTGMGSGIAIPHLHDDCMLKSAIVFIKTKNLEWKSLDNQPVSFIFAIAMSKKDGGDHLEALTQLSKLFLNEKFKTKLNLIKTPNDFLKLVQTSSQEKKLQTPNKSSKSNSLYDVVAITACPTGIAHTFLAADSLKKAAENMGVKIKVETQGTNGEQNVLSQSEINQAKGVILATDKAIETYRFKDHSNVLEMGTKKVISNPKKQIQNVLDQKGIKLKSVTGGASSSSFNSGAELNFNGFGKRMYKSILNGVSYMLPFVVFGGIMIALGFLIDINNVGSPNFGSVNNVAWWFNKIGGLSFGLMVPVLAAYITYAIVGKFGLLPGFVVGLMSVTSGFYGARAPFFQLSEEASSGFFGAIGGAFLSAALLILFIKALRKMPKSLEGIKNILIIPLLGTLIIAGVFYFLNVPFLYLNKGFQEFLKLLQQYPYLAALLGLILGLMMGSDLGGPINKAAYFFGVSTLQVGEKSAASIAMASVMVGGMLPPLVIALSTIIHRKHWSIEDRNSATGNWIFGFSFITEGAIPYTAKRPGILIPANVISAGIAGLVSAALGVTIAAPHGGIFVFGLLSTEMNSLVHLSHSTLIGVGVGFYFIAIIAGLLSGILVLTLLFKIQKPKDNAKASKLQTLLQQKFAGFKNKLQTKSKFCKKLNHKMKNSYLKYLEINYEEFLKRQALVKRILHLK